MASKIGTSRRNWAAGLAVVSALVLGGAVAKAQQTGSVVVTSAPVIVGTPYIGTTLSPSGGAWSSPNPEPSRTETWWEWWRCPSTSSYQGCDVRTRSSTYVVSSSDANEYVFLVRFVRWRDTQGKSKGKGKGNPHDDTFVQQWRPSAPAGPVRAAPTPVPAPLPTVAPTPTPAPGFDTTAPTPVTTQGEVLQETARTRRVIRPFPVVRMKGRLTAGGADVQILSVRAPRSAKVSLRCEGRSCPASRWSRSARKSRLTRMTRFERGLRAGVTLTVSVTRRGHVGKRTTFVIRRGQPPLRSDRCLSSKGSLTRCPSGVS